MTHKAQIQLHYVKFTTVSLKEIDYNSEIEDVEVSYKLGVAHGFDKDVSLKNFGIRITMDIETNNGLQISIEAQSSFTTDMDITEEFISGNFLLFLSAKDGRPCPGRSWHKAPVQTDGWKLLFHIYGTFCNF